MTVADNRGLDGPAAQAPGALARPFGTGPMPPGKLAFAAGVFALLVVCLCVPLGKAVAAGFERVQVPADRAGPAIQAMVWTPCAAPPAVVELGPYVVRGVSGCAIPPIGRLPLVVISHGQGGSLLGHHHTAVALADAGFVVVSLNHPGDSFGDEAAAQRLEVFESRPQDVSRVVTFMLDRWPQRHVIDGDSIGVFGFSRGGYTALALAGAVPSTSASAERLCNRWWSLVMPLCRRIRGGDATLEPAADPRIKAAVVVDPLNLFDAAGFRNVRVPVQLWASELGGDGVALAHVEEIRVGLPAPPEYHVARGAGHFAYLAPCPPALQKSARRICEDPDGFDRNSWHLRMNAFVVEFFRRHLQEG